jgi:hypothetical protein
VQPVERRALVGAQANRALNPAKGPSTQVLPQRGAGNSGRERRQQNLNNFFFRKIRLGCGRDREPRSDGSCGTVDGRRVDGPMAHRLCTVRAVIGPDAGWGGWASGGCGSFLTINRHAGAERDS